MSTTKNLFSLEGKKAFITGAAGGIGSVVAHAMAEAGADIAVIDTNLDAVQKVAEEIKSKHGVQTLALKTDVTDPVDVKDMMSAIEKSFGSLDIALNNAGIVVQVPAETMTYEEWKRVIDVNLNGVFLCAQAAAQHMIPRKKGSIINTASMSATIVNYPQPQCSYNASKAGVVHLTKSLAVEWAPHNVRVNCISPGYINTKLTSTLPQDIKDAWIRDSVMKRLGVPEDLIGILIYLASDASLFATGSDFIVDGGFTCR